VRCLSGLLPSRQRDVAVISRSPWLEQSRAGGSEREQVAPFRFLHRLRLPIALDPRRPQSDGALDCAGVRGNTVIDPMGQLKVLAPIIVRYATLRHATECHAT
jgi:hypothetical protein